MTPRRFSPSTVGIRGSSQPDTTFFSTRGLSSRLETGAPLKLKRENWITSRRLNFSASLMSC